MSRHRRPQVRPRYGRLVAACSSALITLVALLGGLGLVGTQVGSASSPALALDAAPVATVAGAGRAATGRAPDLEAVPVDLDASLPARSGRGRRVVLSELRQRVWLVGEDGRVRRTYLVSGSLTDNLQPGSYGVWSRSEHAVGIDDSGTMKWFVRFTRGPSGAAIGFHTIPVDDGRRVQTVRQLGSPRSHGCIRQRTSDARALWAFAPLGTTVVVVD